MQSNNYWNIWKMLMSEKLNVLVTRLKYISNLSSWCITVSLKLTFLHSSIYVAYFKIDMAYFKIDLDNWDMLLVSTNQLMQYARMTLLPKKYQFLLVSLNPIKVTKHIVPLAIWHNLFLEFWLVDTWFFAYPRGQSAVARLENVRQLNITRGKNLGFKFSHTQHRK